MTRLAVCLLFMASFCVSGCQPSDAALCSDENVSEQCILDIADRALEATQDHFEWTSAAAELAIAYDAAGEPERAAALIDEAIAKSSGIDDVKKQAAVSAEILSALSEIKKYPNANGWFDQISQQAEAFPAAAKANIAAMRVVAEANHGDANSALEAALNLPQEQGYEANYKAITLRKVATKLAKKGDFDLARTAVDAITMSITYYQAMARSDIARLAYKADRNELATVLLTEAEPIARAQENGYFVGAALRDIGYSFVLMGEPEKAEAFFADALEASAVANKPNERARATSRIATRYADAGLAEASTPVLNDAIAFARTIEAENMVGYSYYEIAGSAAFSGEFEITRSLVELVPDSPLGSTASIKSAAQRDFAWGLARYNKLEEAISVASNIETSREKVHALSRIVRLLKNPTMAALPRYL